MLRTVFRLLTPLIFICLLSLGGCGTPASLVSLYGQAVSPESAQRTIVITPTTSGVNVEGGEIIRFVVGDKAFGWNFNNSTTISAFSLNAVAPPGILQQAVRVYISPDPKYAGGGNRD